MITSESTKPYQTKPASRTRGRGHAAAGLAGRVYNWLGHCFPTAFFVALRYLCVTFPACRPQASALSVPGGHAYTEFLVFFADCLNSVVRHAYHSAAATGIVRRPRRALAGKEFLERFDPTRAGRHSAARQGALRRKGAQLQQRAPAVHARGQEARQRSRPGSGRKYPAPDDPDPRCGVGLAGTVLSAGHLPLT